MPNSWISGIIQMSDCILNLSFKWSRPRLCLMYSLNYMVVEQAMGKQNFNSTFFIALYMFWFPWDNFKLNNGSTHFQDPQKKENTRNLNPPSTNSFRMMQGAGVKPFSSDLWCFSYLALIFGTPKKQGNRPRAGFGRTPFMAVRFKEYQEFSLSPTISHIWTKQLHFALLSRQHHREPLFMVFVVINTIFQSMNPFPLMEWFWIIDLWWRRWVRLHVLLFESFIRERGNGKWGWLGREFCKTDQIPGGTQKRRKQRLS